MPGQSGGGKWLRKTVEVPRGDLENGTRGPGKARSTLMEQCFMRENGKGRRKGKKVGNEDGRAKDVYVKGGMQA